MAIRFKVRQAVYTRFKHQQDAAKAAGVTRHTVGKWVNGDLDRRLLESLDKFCRGWGVRVEDLFEYIPDEEAEEDDLVFSDPDS